MTATIERTKKDSGTVPDFPNVKYFDTDEETEAYYESEMDKAFANPHPPKVFASLEELRKHLDRIVIDVRQSR